MNTKTKKIVACFAGSFVCGALLAVLSPALAWLGFVAGACVGYVGYELREFLVAIPASAEQAARVVGAFFRRWLGHLAWAYAWLKVRILGPHPIFKISFAVAAAFGVWLFRLGHGPEISDLDWPILSGAYSLIVFGAVGGLLNLLAILGQRWKMECVISWEQLTQEWLVSCAPRDDRFVPLGVAYDEYFLEHIEDAGYRCAEPTVWNVLRWVAFSPLTALRGTLRALSTFVVGMVRLVHSTERLVCALDSVIGGAIGWWLFRGDPSVPVWVVATCFGAIGAGVGVIHARLAEVVAARLHPIVR